MADKILQSKLQLPGCGLPLDYKPPNGKQFPSALFYEDMNEGWTQLPLYSIRELNMMHLMNQLTDKIDWHKKVFQDEICSKWKSEALATEGVDMTEKMLDWCIAELRYKAKIFEETGFVTAFNGEVYKSDSAIPNSLREELIAGVAPLEDVPDHMKDWHPDSNDLVLDLVHPSLFPLVYGKSRILLEGTTSIDDCIEKCGDGVVMPIPPEMNSNQTRNYNGRDVGKPYSRKFQWLPCEVDISGGHTKITSYINNLHPSKHANLYRTVEKIIDLAIPLWDASLTSIKHPFRPEPRIVYGCVEYDPDPESWPDTEGPQQEEDEGEDDFMERREAWIESIRGVVQPEPGEFKEPERDGDKAVNLKKMYAETGLQVIVKLANIHLTPEKPEYAGGTWHVEGQANEHICASALYYYSSENVAGSKLAFRQHSNVDAASEVGYEQDHHDWLESVFGCSNEEPAVQRLGAVGTSQGRLITFPNILQHQVQPFKLADPTKPGHRKILALFLVDPNIKIISTANIPCQRRDWWRQAITMGAQPQKKVLNNLLPLEIQDKVIDEVDEFPISLEEAKELRLELMEERKHFVVQTQTNFNSFEFSLCEH